jgi:hypothetical protein
MSELYPSDAQLNELSGASDPEQEVLYIATGESPYHTSFYKMLYRLLDVARRSGDLRVFKDGDLTFGIRAGQFMDGPTPRSFAGASAQALTNNAANWVYLTSAGVLTVNTSGLPDPATTPHLPLASIVTSAGQYAHEDITDLRGRMLYMPVGAIPRDRLQLQTSNLAMPLTSMRKGSEGNLSALLGSSADGSDLGLVSTGFGQSGSAPRLVTSSLAAGGTLAQKARFLAALPSEYQSGGAITCRVSARADACQVAATLSLAVYETNGAGGYVGNPTNLCTSPARALTGSYTTLEFSLTAPSGGPGTVLDALLTVSLNDTGGAGGAKQAQIASVCLSLPVRG